MFGMFNKLLYVDLTLKEIKVVAIDDDLYHNYLGGRGLGVKLFTDRVSPDVDPLSPDNALAFTIGPITGTPSPTSGRMSLVTKSPLTGTIFHSNTGGKFSINLKRCGYDGIFISGRSEQAVYLKLDGQNVSLVEADSLWGLDTEQTFEKLKDIEGNKIYTLEIGPAGENQVLISSIMNDAARAFGRGGVGAVMGSKNLKAIVVKNGKHKTSVSDLELLKNYVRTSNDRMKALPVTRSGFPLFGTAGVLHVTNSLGMFPIKNFQYGQHKDADSIGGEAIRKRILQKPEACHGCNIRCGRITKAEEMEGKGPEYESVWALGANCEIFDLIKITKANYHCNKLGLDTISMGVTLSCAMELQEQGILDLPEITFGNTELLTDLVKKTAIKEGIGAELALGSKRLAEKYGAAQSAMQVKGLELPAYDPRGAMGHALGYATSNRGGCHLSGYMAAMEIFNAPKRIPRFTTGGKADLLALKQNQSVIEDSLSTCKFSGFALGFDYQARFVSAITGYDYNVQKLLEIGERVYNLERLFNIKVGFSNHDDSLPDRFLNEPLKEGLSKGHVVPLPEMLIGYYNVRGWDEEGRPTKKKLLELGINPDL